MEPHQPEGADFYVIRIEDFEKHIAESVEAEREACAKIAEIYAEDASRDDYSYDAACIVDAIRARGENPAK